MHGIIFFFLWNYVQDHFDKNYFLYKLLLMKKYQLGTVNKYNKKKKFKFKKKSHTNVINIKYLKYYSKACWNVVEYYL